MSSTHLGVILAHAALGTPFVVITVTATLVGFDHSLIRAAATLGASPVTTFFKIIVPLILPGVISGGLFAFITSFDEVCRRCYSLGSYEQTHHPVADVLGDSRANQPNHSRGGNFIGNRIHSVAVCCGIAKTPRRAVARHHAALNPRAATKVSGCAGFIMLCVSFLIRALQACTQFHSRTVIPCLTPAAFVGVIPLRRFTTGSPFSRVTCQIQKHLTRRGSSLSGRIGRTFPSYRL